MTIQTPAFMKTLMGTSYSYPEVATTSPQSSRRVLLDEPRPDLERHEKLIVEHRRRAAQSYSPIIPRSAVETLLRADDGGDPWPA